MSKSEKKQNPASTSPLGSGNAADDDLKKKITYVAAAVLIVAMAGALFLSKSKKSDNKLSEQNKILGPAFIYISRNQFDSTVKYIEDNIFDDHPDIVKSKANLLLGRANYNLGHYDKSLEAYEKVQSGVDLTLLQSGALHGIGASYMQQGNYQLALDTYNEFISKYMKKNKEFEENISVKDVQDLSAAIPNVLWKLVLLNDKMGNKENAKQNCKLLLKHYSDQEEAKDAERFLQTLS